MDKEFNTKIKETTNYSQFKKLEGNRDLLDGRIKKIMDSIEKIGYILSPILVNEKLEVIDGQGRLEALKRLKLPVHYIIQNGIGLKECQQMNIHQTNWTDFDFVKSYATKGKQDFRRLQSLLEAYKKLPKEVVYMSASEELSDRGNKYYSTKIRDGSFVISEQKYESSRWELEYASELKDVAKTIGGATRPFYVAVIFAYRNLDCNKRNRMKDLIIKHQYQLASYSSAEDYLKSFDGFYNSRYKPKAKDRLCLAMTWHLDHMS